MLHERKEKWKRRVVALALVFLMLDQEFWEVDDHSAKPEEEKQKETFYNYDADRIFQNTRDWGRFC